jgi:hypothetical protein
VALDQQYITKAKIQDVYDHAGPTRAAFEALSNTCWNMSKVEKNKDSPER